jgi:recombinational DNA repair protein (RecF pathway)
LLQCSGYQPMLERCGRCRGERSSNRNGRWHFSPRDGGVLCAGCSVFRKEALPIDREGLDALIGLQRCRDSLSAERLCPSVAIGEARSVLVRFIEFQLRRELKSARFIESLSSLAVPC